MNIIMAASEVSPFAKTGGLADVVGAVPKSLLALGHTVSVFMPLYTMARKNCTAMTDTKLSVTVPVGENLQTCRIHKAFLPGTAVPVYFVENDRYYQRDALYGKGGADFADNSERFIFFSRAVLEAVVALRLPCDVIHCHDWQTGLIPVYLKTIYKGGPAFARTGTLFTIHNLAYQGVFWHWDMKLTGLDWSLFNWKQLEFWGKVNFMKGGLVFADLVSTVSETYSKEIQTPDFGCGLEGVLRERSKDLFGVINGIDYEVWNPAVDPLIPTKYDAKRLNGKAACKKFLQRKCGLPVRKAPLIGMISRLADQKGFDLAAEVMAELLNSDVQFVVLGTGEPKYHDLLNRLARSYPDRMSVTLGFDNQMAHEIEAGADMFLMPSRFEPCGLNQLYSLKYGTAPVVRSTGGLADTVVDCTPETLDKGAATGFSFEKYSAADLLATLKRALACYADRKTWLKLIKNGMGQNWSWDESARKYVKLYGLARNKAQSA
jgi:starch synthase